jgi:hypothetical protein
MRVSLNAACSIIAGVLMMVSAIHCFYKDRRVSYAPIINVVAGLVSLLTGIILVDFTLSWQSVNQQFKTKWFTSLLDTLSIIFSLTTSIYPAILIKIANRSMKSNNFRTDRILVANIALAAVAVLVSVIEEFIALAEETYTAAALSESNWSIGSKKTAFIIAMVSRIVTIAASGYTILHILPTLVVPSVVIYGALSLLLLLLLQSCNVVVDLWRFLIRIGQDRNTLFYVIFNWASFIGAASLCLYALIASLALNRHLQASVSSRMFKNGFLRRQSSIITNSLSPQTEVRGSVEYGRHRSKQRVLAPEERGYSPGTPSTSSIKRSQSIPLPSVATVECPDEVEKSLLDIVLSTKASTHKQLQP